MGLCTAQVISTPPCQNKLFASSPSLSTVQSKTSLALSQSVVSIPTRCLSSRLVYYSSTLVRSIPEGPTNGADQYGDEEPSGLVTLENVTPVEKDEYKETVQPEVTNLGDTSANGETQTFGLLDNMNWDFHNTYFVALYGIGAFSALYLASAIVGAIDSIPLFPKLMEVVGLSYSMWFSYRYLLFKQNRDELAAKIEDLKQRVTGSKDE